MSRHTYSYRFDDIEKALIREGMVHHSSRLVSIQVHDNQPVVDFCVDTDLPERKK